MSNIKSSWSHVKESRLFPPWSIRKGKLLKNLKKKATYKERYFKLTVVERFPKRQELNKRQCREKGAGRYMDNIEEPKKQDFVIMDERPR